MTCSQDSTKLVAGMIMSNNTEYQEIINAINRLSSEVHNVSNYLTRLDERIIALDNKVDNRVNSVEVQVKGLETRVQGLVDKCQDIEIRLNRSTDSLKELQKDYDADKAQQRSWMNKYVIPLLLAGTIAIVSSAATLTWGK